MKNLKNIIIALVIIILIVAAIVGVVIFINSSNKEYELEKIEKYSYFKLYQNEKYGVIDDKGNILIEANYDVVNIPNPSKPLFVCYYDYDDMTGEYKTKVLNEKNEEILTEYEQVLPLMCEESTSNIPFEKTVLKYKENGKYGIIDFEGKKITKAIYEEIDSMKYREGTLLVKQDGKYGAINIKGKEIVSLKYDEIKSDEYYTQENDYTQTGFIVQLRTEDGYRYGYLDKDGKEILEVVYNEINRITEIKNNEPYLLVSKNGKYGIVKAKKTIVPYTYEEIEYNKANQLFIVQKNSKQGVLSLEGNQIIPVEYDYILCTENKITTTKGESIEIYNAKGEKKDSKYDNSIEIPNKNYIITINEEDKFGITDKNGNNVVENKYEYLEYAFENYFIATDEGKVGVINVNGDIIIDFNYDIIQTVKDKNILQAIISSTNTIEMYNNKIEKQASMKDSILYTYDNYIKLISNNDMIYLDNNGNKIDNKDIFTENVLFSYKKDGKWGFVDKEGKVIVQNKYDMVTEFNVYGFAGIKKEDKWGVINIDGQVIVAPTYKIDWNEPEFIGKYCKLNFGYGFEYYTDELTK